MKALPSLALLNRLGRPSTASSRLAACPAALPSLRSGPSVTRLVVTACVAASGTATASAAASSKPAGAGSADAAVAAPSAGEHSGAPAAPASSALCCSSRPAWVPAGKSSAEPRRAISRSMQRAQQRQAYCGFCRCGLRCREAPAEAAVIRRRFSPRGGPAGGEGLPAASQTASAVRLSLRFGSSAQHKQGAQLTSAGCGEGDWQDQPDHDLVKHRSRRLAGINLGSWQQRRSSAKISRRNQEAPNERG